MRSAPWKEHTVRERLMSARWSLQRHGAPKPPAPRRIVRFVNGHAYEGHASQHKTAEARRWLLMWRLRFQRGYHARLHPIAP
jgi:hypothetical protein